MPAWIPGSYLIRDFSRQVETIQATCEDEAIAITKSGNHTWVCQPCSGALLIEYTVYAWDLSVRSAHLDESHAFLNGTSVFLGVSGQEHKPCTVTVCPPPHTSNWSVYTTLPEATQHPEAAQRHGFGAYQAPDHDALVDHPIEMGTSQTISFTAHGADHELVFTGVIPNLDLDRIAADVKKICEAQIELFDPMHLKAPFIDSSDRYVFMTTVTGDGYGGLEHRSSTALLTSRDSLPAVGIEPDHDKYQQFLGLVSHEYFHTWNVKRIKPQVFAPYTLTTENHTSLLWVFEGFTSYYDDLMLYRSGVASKEDYLKRLGKVISMVHRAPGRLKQSVAESSFDTWTRFYKQDENSPNAIVSYYSKGALVALGLDLFIRQNSHGKHCLDDVMRLMWQRYGKNFYQSGSHSGQGKGINDSDMPVIIMEATGVDTAAFIQEYVYGCKDIPLMSLLDAAGLKLDQAATSKAPSLGVRLKTQGSLVTIATAYEGGAAHLGGLSAGDTIVAVEGLRVASIKGLESILQRWQPLSNVTVHVFRRDELRAFDVCLQEPAADEYTVHQLSDHISNDNVASMTKWPDGNTVKA